MQQDKCSKKCDKCELPEKSESQFSQILTKIKGRLTGERKVLLQILCKMHGHFNAEKIQKALKNSGFDISITTIYRNLDLLIEAQIIRKVGDDASGTLYEYILGREHHDHLTCTNCAVKIEFKYTPIDILQNEVAKEHGFTLTDHNLELFGLCPKCQKIQKNDFIIKTLLELKEGDTGRILKITGSKSSIAKLTAHGLNKGKIIKVIKFAPFKGPILLEDIESGAKIMTARDMAQNIEIKIERVK